MEFNKYQSSLEELNIDKQPKEVQEQFFDFINNVPYIKSHIDVNIPTAKDLPKDKDGKIIIDLSKPHIFEDMDYFRPTAIHYQKYGCLTHLRPNPNPNSEYGKWIREEIRRCYDGYIRKSDGEWITGDMYFFLNYCPILLTKIKHGRKAERVWDFPEFWEGHYYKFHYINQARNNGHHGAELAARGRGKAHPYDEIVYTPEGQRLWKDIQVGDYIFGDNGNITKVIDIPFDGVSPIYEIELSNGYKVKCSDEHLWKVKSHSLGREVIVSTKTLLNMYKRKRKVTNNIKKGYELDCTIPKGCGVEFSYRATKVDPYTFGLMLGDGCFRIPRMKNKAYFTANKDDFEVYNKYIPYNWVKYSNTKCGYNLNIPNFGDILKDYGLFFVKSEDKFIPQEYMQNSREVRISLLKGILDADGTVTNGKIEIVLSSRRMIGDIQWICSSLGIPTSTIREKKTWYYDMNRIKVPCLTAYRLSIFSDISLFNLPRKTNLWENRSKTNYGRSKYNGYKITNIRYIGESKAKCVTVDNESHCYLIGNFIVTHNSYSLASMLARRFILGESKEVNKEVKCLVTAYQKEYLTKDGILNKFQSYIDFCAQNTQFPSKRLKSSLQDMSWTMGYIDLDTGTRRGTLNEVLGISSKDDESKLRGKRGVLIALEEWGSFPNLLGLYGTLRPSVEEGDSVFGLIFAQGTAGDSQSDFAAAQEIMYNPLGYNMQEINNVYDKEGQGRKYFVYFFPGYINRKGCYDKDGNSDITKALLEILINRYTVKYNSTDINAISKAISEVPITPQEAIIRTTGSIFPITELNERLNQIDNTPNFYDSTYIGDLVYNGNKQVEFTPTTDIPIRDFPTKDNKLKGAIEIFNMPEKDPKGEIPQERYITFADPYDDDTSNTMSLGSVMCLDLWTDTIVAEYTGRPTFADDYYEVVRKLTLFYNARCMYEQNKKGLFAYFSRYNCVYLLADTPEYLRDKQLIKDIGYGNKSKGVNATQPIKNYGYKLIRDWLLKPYTKIEKDDSGNDIEVQMPNLYRIKNRALLKELILWNPDINVDRIMALVQGMLYREEKMILYNGNLASSRQNDLKNYAGNDPFFEKNYDSKFKHLIKDVEDAQ